MKIIIIDDDLLDRNNLIEQLQKLHQQIEVVAICDNMNDGFTAINKLKPELVFLDIDLGGGETGFDLLKMFKRLDFAVVFTTHHNSNNNLLNAIRASALDFLVKPVLLDELENALSQFYKKTELDKEQQLEVFQENIATENSKIKNICIPNSDGQTRLEVQNIMYCEAANSSTHFFVANPIIKKPVSADKKETSPVNQKFTSSKGIRFWEKIFSNSDVLRIHNSFLVNINYVVRYKTRLNGALLILNDGTELPVSKGKKEYLKERWELHNKSYDNPKSN